MCGIIGVASTLPVGTRRWLEYGNDALAHRGPDDAGIWWTSDARVGLGHRRLAILDLSTAGHQPMLGHNGNICIVFNGEIYNFRELRQELQIKGHRFSSRTDTEVVIAAYCEWGIDCLRRLNGMFALAIYDARQQALLIARDRAGEKPLFYRYAGQTLQFASELKALLADSSIARRINPESLDCYLTMGFIPGDRCIFEGLHKLPPAHALRFDLKAGHFRMWRYWQLPEISVISPPSYSDETTLTEKLELLLEDAVGRQLVADVPVGVLLSGGVDSSLVTAMAVRKTSKVRTFTVCFPDHDRLNEAKHARLIARHFGTEHVELEARPATVNLLSQLARQFDEPIVDSSMIPTFLVTQVVRQHCKVALGGDGGDELFGGYSHYSRLLWMESWLGWLPSSIRLAVQSTAVRFLPTGTRGRAWLVGLGADLRQGLPLIACYFDAPARRRLMSQHGVWSADAEAVWNHQVWPANNLLQRATRTDFNNYLPEDILVKVDRASMLNSLEVRAPFLDHKMIEFAYGEVPSSLKAMPHERKILLKRLCDRILPPGFDRQRKQGFMIPINEWLKSGAFRDCFYSLLLHTDCIFDKKTVRALWKEQDSGKTNGERLFSLAFFELWRREYAASL